METQDVFTKDLQRLKNDVTKILNNRYCRLDKKKKWAAAFRKIMTDYREALEQKIEIDRILKSQKDSCPEDEDELFLFNGDDEISQSYRKLKKKNKGKTWWQALGYQNNPVPGID